MGEAIFFDLDGTLCNAQVPFRDVLLAACEPLIPSDAPELGARLLDAWFAVPRLGAMTHRIRLERTLSQVGLRAPATLLEHCTAALSEKWAATQRVATGVPGVLDRLRRRYTLGIISNGASDGQMAIVNTLDLNHFFDCVIISGDVQVAAWKPDGAIFRRALTVASAEPKESWHVGDSFSEDIVGAAAAGMRTCWQIPATEVSEHVHPEPDLCVSSLSQFADHFGL